MAAVGFLVWFVANREKEYFFGPLKNSVSNPLNSRQLSLLGNVQLDLELVKQDLVLPKTVYGPLGLRDYNLGLLNLVTEQFKPFCYEGSSIADVPYSDELFRVAT